MKVMFKLLIWIVVAGDIAISAPNPLVISCENTPINRNNLAVKKHTWKSIVMIGRKRHLTTNPIGSVL